MNIKEIIIIEEDNKERFLEEINNWKAKVGIEIKDIKYSIGVGSTNDGIINDRLYSAMIIYEKSY